MSFHIQGRCELMCPLSEVKRRQEKDMIHTMERKNGKKEADVRKMVKEYVRPAYRTRPFQADEIRTPETLLLTTEYLINELARNMDHPWHIVYEFISDRLRAIRQEIILQNVSGRIKIKVLEYCTLFHLYSSYRLCDAKADQFNDALNSRWLRECIGQLLSSYNEDYSDNRRLIFECIYLLIDLGSLDAISRYKHIPSSIRQHERYRQCMKINTLLHQNNYFAVIHSLKQACCLLRIAFNLRLFEVMESYFNRLSYACAALSGCAITYNYLARLFRPYDDEEEVYHLSWVKKNIAKDRVQDIDGEMMNFTRAVHPTKLIHRRKWKCVDTALGNNVDLVRLLEDFK